MSAHQTSGRKLRGDARRLHGQRGQATVEYVLVLLALVAAAVIPLGPATFAGRTEVASESIFPQNSFMGACIKAYTNYYKAHYFVLNLPFP